MRREREGSDVPPTISFRAISPNGLWVSAVQRGWARTGGGRGNGGTTWRNR